MRDGERMEEERGGDESWLRGEEEQQQVVVGGVPLTPSPVRLLVAAIVQKVSLPSSGVPSGLSHTPCTLSPHPFTLSPSHMEAHHAKCCVNVTRSARPPSSLPLPSLLLFFHLFPPPPVCEHSSLAIQMGFMCDCVCLCIGKCAI
ncbi:hypothetical protein CRENBAI_000407 [Crenichthys baileyi]|uniref:Uncharacterized protein n=1 Tax=Crenichthys baileyi TaxID=28760 RepID=A0AAV9SCF1_9TELE